MRKILVATYAERQSAIQAAFGHDYEMIFCHSIADAEEKLTPDVRMILCNIHFGDGEMFALLRHAKENPETRDIPFLCIDDSHDELPPSLCQSVEIATRTLGAAAFISFAHWRTNFGEREAFERASNVIRDLLQQSQA